MWRPPFNPLRAPWNNTNDINDQIDWAVLAKNWIQQKEMFGDLEEPPANVNPLFQPESTSIESLDPSLTTVNISDMPNAETTDYTNFDNLYENYETNGEEWQEWGFDSYQEAAWMDPTFDQQPSNSNIMNANNLNLPAWAVPPPPPPPDNHSQEVQNKVPMLSEIQLNMFNLANQNLTQNSMPFNPNPQRPLNFTQHRPQLGPGFPNMWMPIGQRMPPPNVPKLMGDLRPRMRQRPPHIWAPQAYNHITSTIDDSFLDANRRRQLPAWIREGLEKMEREKQKQLDKERKKQMEMEAKQQKLLEQQLIDPSISKFDESENEDEVEEGEDIGDAGDTVTDELAEVGGEEEAQVVEEQISEEEKQIRLILKVKQWMTEILLDVTNSEMVAIVERVFRRAKLKQAKAPARQLVSSSALASLFTLGNDSENEETEVAVAEWKDGDVVGSDTSESEDEAIFSERLKCKRLQFERRMKLLEQQNYQSDVLPELVDNSRATIPVGTQSNDVTKEDSSSGEIRSDDDDESHIAIHKSHHKRDYIKNKKTPSSEKESVEQKKISSNQTKRKFEEHVVQIHKDSKSSNGNKNLRHRESTDSKEDRETLKCEEPMKMFSDSSLQNRSNREHYSSKNHRKRSKSSERRSPSKRDKKDRRSGERSRNETYERRRRDSSNQSHDNKSHRDRKNRRHRSRSRS